MPSSGMLIIRGGSVQKRTQACRPCSPLHTAVRLQGIPLLPAAAPALKDLLLNSCKQSMTPSSSAAVTCVQLCPLISSIGAVFEAKQTPAVAGLLQRHLYRSGEIPLQLLLACLLVRPHAALTGSAAFDSDTYAALASWSAGRPVHHRVQSSTWTAASDSHLLAQCTQSTYGPDTHPGASISMQVGRSQPFSITCHAAQICKHLRTPTFSLL